MGRIEKFTRVALVTAALATAGCATPKLPGIGADSTPTPPTSASTQQGQTFEACSAIRQVTVDGKPYPVRPGAVVVVDFPVGDSTHQVSGDPNTGFNCQVSGPNPTQDQIDATETKAINTTVQQTGTKNALIRRVTING